MVTPVWLLLTKYGCSVQLLVRRHSQYQAAEGELGTGAHGHILLSADTRNIFKSSASRYTQILAADAEQVGGHACLVLTGSLGVQLTLRASDLHN